MDNNSFNDGMGNPSNMQQNMSPNMQSGMQEMQSNMGMPMGPMGPGMGQPYPQQMMRPPKQPMDPAKKRRVILIVCIISGLLVVGIALAIILPMVLRVDYSTAYNTAKELQPKIYDIYQSYDCEYVVDYVDSSYTSTKTYDGYVEGCKEVYNPETDGLVNQLENTDGVKRNDEIKIQFGKFKNEYMALSAGNAEELSYKLGLWQARHNFVVAADDLSYSSSDAEFTTTANYLINSGNDTLKTYGEGWLEWKLAIAAAYRAYDNASWSDYSAYRALRDTYNNKKTEFEDWLATNKPDISTVAPLSFNDTSKMYSEFNKLYDLISGTYALNYNAGSGDCDELFGEIYCE